MYIELHKNNFGSVPLRMLDDTYCLGLNVLNIYIICLNVIGRKYFTLES